MEYKINTSKMFKDGKEELKMMQRKKRLLHLIRQNRKNIAAKTERT